MRFDTIIIGGGLSGLVGGIALSLRGERVAIFSSGKSALHYSSGSLELCHKGGAEIAALAEGNPSHPYTRPAYPSFSLHNRHLGYPLCFISFAAAIALGSKLCSYWGWGEKMFSRSSGTANAVMTDAARIAASSTARRTVRLTWYTTVDLDLPKSFLQDSSN